MRSFLSMLAALLVAGVIAFSVWKHEGWVTAKNASISLMSNPDEALSVAGAHDLIAVFSTKILPFSSSDRYWLAKAKEIAEAGEFNSAYSYLVLKMRASMAASLCEEEGEKFLADWEKTGRLSEERRKTVEEAIRRVADSKRHYP